MTASFRLTPRAEQDLRAIVHYTQAQWGREQRDAYLGARDRRFRVWAEHPRLGRPRSDVKEG